MGSSQRSKLVFWVLSFAPINRIPYRSCLSSPSYQMFTSVAGASHAVPYNLLAAGSIGWELRWSGSLFIFSVKSRSYQCKPSEKTRCFFVFFCAWCSWDEAEAGSATGEWSAEWSRSCHWSLMYLSLSTSYTYTVLGTAEIQFSLHSYGQSFKEEIKDLVNCCFNFFILFYKPACPCRSFTKAWAFLLPVDILWKGECQWKLDLLMNTFCGQQVRWKFMKDLNLSLWPWTNSMRKEKAVNLGRRDW